MLVDDAAARRECRLDGGAWGACPASVAVGDGAHVFEARAIDAGGRTGVAEPWRWTTDLSAPNTTVTGAPPADNALFKVLLGVAGTATAERFECRIDTSEWLDCSRGAWLIQDVSQGEHVAVVRAVNASGTPDPTPVVLRWRTDFDKPSLKLVQRSPEPTKRPTATFEVVSDDPTARSSAACASARLAALPRSLHGQRPPAGPAHPHRPSGRRRRQHHLDRRELAPDRGHPRGDRDHLRPQITPYAVRFLVGQTGPALGCRLDGGEWRTCTGGDVWCCTPMPPGTHTIEFASIGPDGDRDPTPATRTWTIAGPTPTPTATPP